MSVSWLYFLECVSDLISAFFLCWPVLTFKYGLVWFGLYPCIIWKFLLFDNCKRNFLISCFNANGIGLCSIRLEQVSYHVYQDLTLRNRYEQSFQCPTIGNIGGNEMLVYDSSTLYHTVTVGSRRRNRKVSQKT